MERGADSHDKQIGPFILVLGMVSIWRRLLSGSVSAILLIGLVAITGVSETINLLIADPSPYSLFFLLMLAVLLADLIAKFIGILSSTFPDLIPKVDEENLKRASIISLLRPGPTVALLSGAYAARVVLFFTIFALLGASYAATPSPVQQSLFGDFSTNQAIDAFIREGIAGSLGYFLFFLGPDNLAPVTNVLITEPLATSTIDGDLLLVGIRLYGLALVLALLQTLAAPITYLRARLRAKNLTKVS